MAYYFKQFGNDLPIPVDDQETTFNRKIQDGTLVALPNGSYFNAYQNTPLLPPDVVISFALIRNSPNELLEAYARWEERFLSEQTGMLWRVPNSGCDESQSCLAKLKDLSATPPIHSRSSLMRITATFALLRDRWSGANLFSLRKDFSELGSGKTMTFLVDRGKGNAEINDSCLFLKVNTGVVFRLQIWPENQNRGFAYAGNLAAPDSLKIDDATDSVIKNSAVPVYANVTQSFSADQEASSAWMPITKNGALKVRLEGDVNASGYVELRYYRAYA